MWSGVTVLIRRREAFSYTPNLTWPDIVEPIPTADPTFTQPILVIIL